MPTIQHLYILDSAAVYRELYPEEDEGVVASAQVIYGIAWKEH
jgi:hypothetical protein